MILNRLGSSNLVGKLNLEQRFEGAGGVAPVEILGKSALGS